MLVRLERRQVNRIRNLPLPDSCNPDFVDEASRDFRLGANSDAIDMCDFPAPTLDRASNTTGFDLPRVTDWLGPFDAGAFERIE